jgi:hypothetical protein
MATLTALNGSADAPNSARPGVHLSIAALTTDPAESAAVVRVRLTGGAAPVKLHLYVDGELVEAWTQAPDTCEYDAGSVAAGRHVVTARVVDALGRWCGASTVLDARYPLAGI